ncbi:PLP-dependent aminotransferase family protein [Trinickia violacea]|uniref:PLP-dependent aminotransferase family protein n=1 Tax=Trinickia violacea TaxID=2571746 RepID=A0A4P8IWD2_9BURK|nr:PLP-dependent aminotransferase family protein [Trinickia violacea]QCP52756.1 PLP-dependent aminotransferase family protein [Trinickia violacea]
MTKPLQIQLDRSAKTPLAEQIRKAICTAIESGVLSPGARLPSWLDLAAQLGVARGTVRLAYDRLADAQLIIASRTTGTRVADRPPAPVQAEERHDPGSFMEMYGELTEGPVMFRMGVPGQETLPAKLFTKVRSFAVRAENCAAVNYPDPRGELELRREIAAYLAISRGVTCSPAQIVITSGFSGGLGLTLRVLGLEGKRAWVENPCFPFTRHGLELANMSLSPIPVDAEGLDIDYGLEHEPNTDLVVITPGQQAPLGPTLSLTRRLRLLDWASKKGVWIIEDDYLSELQLTARAAPALASLDRGQRVIHIGSFSKTISPALRLGFVVAPLPLVSRFAEVAACLAPAPWMSVQLATARFMRDGHYMRHLRRMKRLYAAQRDALLKCLEQRTIETTTAGLAVLVRLPDGASDMSIARALSAFGLGPAPLSPWYASPASARSGLLLGVATSPERHLATSCDRLHEVITRYT